jgi:hypothetical protein
VNKLFQVRDSFDATHVDTHQLQANSTNTITIKDFKIKILFQIHVGIIPMSTQHIYKQTYIHTET